MQVTSLNITFLLYIFAPTREWGSISDPFSFLRFYLIYYFLFLSNLYTQHRTQTPNAEIERHTLHQLRQQGALMYYSLNFSYGRNASFLFLMCNYKLAILLKRNDLNVDSFHKSIEIYMRFK